MRLVLEDLLGLDEDLKVAQVAAAKTLSSHSDDYDALYEKVKDKIEDDKETELKDAVDDTAGDSPGAEDTPPAEPSPEATPEGESPKEPEAPESADEETEADQVDAEAEPPAPQKDAEGKQQSVATESLRNEYYDRQVVTEALGLGGFGDSLVAGGNALGAVITVGGGIARDATVWLAGKAWDLGKFLGALGIQYSPAVWRGLKKTVSFLFLKSAKALLKTAITVGNFRKRFGMNYGKFKKQIHALRAALHDLQVQDIEAPVAGKTHTKGVEWFIVGQQVGPVPSAQAVQHFLKDSIDQIDRGLSEQLLIVKKLIETTTRLLPNNLIQYFQVAPFEGSFLKKTLPGYVKDPALVQSFLYKDALPDRMTLIAQLPVRSLLEMDDISKAYQESNIFMGADPRPALMVDKVDYVDLKALAGYLDILEQICDLGLAHQAFYQKVEKQCSELKFGYRHYYQRLVETKDEATVRESLVEYVYLKQAFASRVYVPAAMDVHDFVTAYLVRGLRYAKANLVQLKG